MKPWIIVRGLAIGIVVFAASACSTLDSQAPRRATHEILVPFVSQSQQDHIAVRVSSSLADGTLSDAQLKKLSAFICTLLRESGDFTMVRDLTASEETGSGPLLLEVEVTAFDVAGEAELEAGGMSQLDGTIQVTDARDSDQGRAKISASGDRLALEDETRPPDTVVQFARTVVRLLR